MDPLAVCALTPVVALAVELPDVRRAPTLRAPRGPRRREDSPEPERARFAPAPVPAAKRSLGDMGEAFPLGGERERADAESEFGVGGETLTGTLSLLVLLLLLVSVAGGREDVTEGTSSTSGGGSAKRGIGGGAMSSFSGGGSLKTAGIGGGAVRSSAAGVGLNTNEGAGEASGTGITTSTIFFSSPFDSGGGMIASALGTLSLASLPFLASLLGALLCLPEGFGLPERDDGRMLGFLAIICSSKISRVSMLATESLDLLIRMSTGRVCLRSGIFRSDSRFLRAIVGGRSSSKCLRMSMKSAVVQVVRKVSEEEMNEVRTCRMTILD